MPFSQTDEKPANRRVIMPMRMPTFRKDDSAIDIITKLAEAASLNPKRRSLRQNNTIPPQLPEHEGRLTVVLDVDETLVHSEVLSTQASRIKAMQDMRGGSKHSSSKHRFLEQKVITLLDGERVRVFKRPGVDEFLSELSKHYEVFAFTAGMKSYASPVLDWLEESVGPVFSHRLYRDSCEFRGGFYLKNLSKLERDVRRIVLVDNNPVCFIPNAENGIPILSFYDDHTDSKLVEIANVLEDLKDKSDVRPILSERFKIKQLLFRSSCRGLLPKA